MAKAQRVQQPSLAPYRRCTTVGFSAGTLFVKGVLSAANGFSVAGGGMLPNKVALPTTACMASATSSYALELTPNPFCAAYVFRVDIVSARRLAQINQTIRI